MPFVINKKNSISLVRMFSQALKKNFVPCFCKDSYFSSFEVDPTTKQEKVFHQRKISSHVLLHPILNEVKIAKTRK